MKRRRDFSVRVSLLVSATCVVWVACLLDLCVDAVSRIEIISPQSSVRSTYGRWGLLPIRGGAVDVVRELSTTWEMSDPSTEEDDGYTMLANIFHSRFRSNVDGTLPKMTKLVTAFKSMSAAQKAFKGLDGAAHEAYQRTHATDEVDLTVAGRAKRSAARTSAVAVGLGACELCELIEHPHRFDLDDTANGTLAGRTVLLNVTDVVPLGGLNVSVLVLYEPAYSGGAGVHHGGIEDLTEDTGSPEKAKGRLLVVIADTFVRDLNQTLRTLEQEPRRVPVRHGDNDFAVVQPSLYNAAASVLRTIEPLAREYNTSAIHFSGMSLSGGIATLAAIMLNGDIPLPVDRRINQIPPKRPGLKKEPVDDRDTNGNETSLVPLRGLGMGRTSAVALGPPPCISDNIVAHYVTSLLYGDDIVCRVTPESLERFFQRARRGLERGGLIGKRLNFMTDTVSLATSSLQSQVMKSKNKRLLAVAGQAYLIRPRRLAGSCSIHEVGTKANGGRDALRAAVLWQLNDILLSRSMWKHHQLDSYIQGIDRVHLRGLDDKEPQE